MLCPPSPSPELSSFPTVFRVVRVPEDFDYVNARRLFKEAEITDAKEIGEVGQIVIMMVMVMAIIIIVWL